jgi:hypothetical protein
VKRLFIEDWTRRQVGYDTVFEGELYHMVKDRDAPGFRIESNDREIQMPVPVSNKKLPAFGIMRGRRDSDVTHTLNDSRFEIIDKQPQCLSSVPRVPGFSFQGH